jgi:hypothetical protein
MRLRGVVSASLRTGRVRGGYYARSGWLVYSRLGLNLRLIRNNQRDQIIAGFLNRLG